MTTSTTPATIGQVVQSAYHWAHDELPTGTFIAPDEVEGSAYWQGGDGLMAFLMQELVENTADADGTEDDAAHWAEARRRAATVLHEVQRVCHALSTYGPEEIDG